MAMHVNWTKKAPELSKTTSNNIGVRTVDKDCRSSSEMEKITQAKNDIRPTLVFQEEIGFMVLVKAQAMSHERIM